MAGSWKQIAIITAFVFIFAVHTQNSKLNVPRVLLPLFKEFCTNFTLEVSDSGCYKWCVFICKVMCGNNLRVVMYLMCETYSWIIYIS
jgi:nuclear pore complex protein Nup210